MLEHAALVETINTRESMTIDVFDSLSNICDRPSYVIFKEIVDIMFASFAVLFLLPLFPLICLMVKLDSPGPVFYSQSRVGRFGRRFRMYKFRTMYVDAEKYTGPVWSSKDDPRITRVGKWLRKIYIDELPQCINIILGDMSLVGPRPERPEFMRLFEELVPGFSRRNAVKPGITGLAQVSCFYKMVSSDIRKKLKYDLFYIRKHCCVMDIRIIVKTVKFWLNSCIG